MLGWMIKGGIDASAPTADADTTQMDNPDTPAPVFAARAFRAAIFGQPTTEKPTPGKQQVTASQELSTPSKPQGILLTPGTGTAKRKRVSFGHDIAKAQPNFHAGNKRESKASNRHSTTTKTVAADDDNSDEEWEEEEDFCQHDVTVDLNEPHSRSGKFWKESFQKYHQDAKVEMDKLWKYKQLAKDYARHKDSEANELAGLLKDEQQRVVKMERKIAENASRMVANDAGSAQPSELVTKLSKQTALAVQYRERVRDLEKKLQVHGALPADTDKLETNEHRRQLASPKTHKTLMETQRELRKARAQVREVGALRDQVASLKTRLKAAEEKNTEKTTEMKRLKGMQADSLPADEWKRELEALREANASQKAVLERAQAKIAELKKENRTLKAGASSSRVRGFGEKLALDEPAKSVDKAALSQPVVHRQTMQQDVKDPIYPATGAKGEDGLSKSLREQFLDAESLAQISTAATRGPMANRPTLEKPRWQPFVPRSPRNRAYLGEILAKQSSKERTQSRNHTKITEPAIPTMSGALAETAPSDANDRQFDLLENRFTSLGGPQASAKRTRREVSASSSTNGLPPDRRAAALARIEKRMAEKQHAARLGLDKENMRPA